jgi:hypothetical protein
MISWGIGRGATAWRPWADRCHGVGLLAQHINDRSANGRDVIAPHPIAFLVNRPAGQRINSCCIHSQVTGDGHLGIGHSGVGISAISCRLRDPGG